MNCKSWRIAAAALAGALAAGSNADAACHLTKYPDMPVAMEGLRAIIPAKINGVEVRFMVDTGAFYSMLTPEAAKRLKIQTSPVTNLRVEGLGGESFVDAGEAREFVFAGVPLKHIEFIVGGREFASDTVGVLGENVLSVADMEYDFAHGMMRFVKEQDCYKSDLAYWANGSADSIHIDPIVPPLKSDIIGTAKVNGKTMRVEFDSGMPVSLLSLSAAERAGIRPDSPGVVAAGLTGGLGRARRESWIAPVESFSIGSEEIKNTRLRIAKLELNDVDMLLGMDFFLSHRMLVSHTQNRLFFSYNGGPVFQLDQAPLAPAPAQAAAGAGGEAAAAAPPLDAEGYGREGEALMSRREYAAALDAFDKAVALDAKTPRRYVDRAHARQALGRSILAMADYDRALELKPDYAAALIGRGELFLRNGDLPRAQADFEAALKAARYETGLRLRIAAAYERNARYALAIEQFDAWIGANRKDEDLWEGLLGRCRARLWSGQDLDKAVDDYDVALKLQPKLAAALYGRGLAKKRMGAIGDGEVEMTAAIAIEPNVRTRFERLGVTEPKAAPAKADAPKTEPAKSEPLKSDAGQPKG